LNIEQAKALEQERIKLVREAVAMNGAPERVPILDSTFTWKIMDQGYTLSEAIYDYEKMEKVVRGHQELYQCDLVRDVGTRNGFQIIQGWTEPRYVVDDVNGSLNAPDMVIMNPDEYDELAEERLKFIWTKALPRRYPMLQHSTKEEIQKLIVGMQQYFAFGGKMNNILKTEYGVPSIAKHAVSGSGHENIVNKFRGIAGTGIDARRNPKGMLKVIEMYAEKEIYPAIDRIRKDPGQDWNFAFDCQGGMLTHSILSSSQFDKFYWPWMKQGLDALADTGKSMYLFIQSDIKRFIHHFKDYPKGMLCLHLEIDDPYEVRKELPNACICGGIPISLLGGGTKEECIEYAKRLINDLGQDGGFILSTDKILSFRNDAKRENLLALYEFVREYKG